MQPDDIPGLVFGAFLVILAIFMVRAQRKARAEISSTTDDPSEMRFLQNRVRRRTQVAWMIGLIGVMIPIGDSLIDWEGAFVTFALYWLIVMGLACWVGVLALGDMAATHAHSAIELNLLKHQQQELERVAEQLRKQQNQSSTDQNS